MWVAPLIQDADFITPAYLEDDLHEPMPSHGTATRAKTPPWEYPLDVHPNVARHLDRWHHGMSTEECRQEVLGRVLLDSPQPVSAQVLRTRLIAFYKEFKS